MDQNTLQDPLSSPPGTLLTTQECLNSLYPREISANRLAQFEQALLALLDHPVLKTETQTVEDPPFTFRGSFSFWAAQFVREKLRLPFFWITSEVFFEKYIPGTTSVDIIAAFWKILKREHKEYMKKEWEASNTILAIKPSALWEVIKLYNSHVKKLTPTLIWTPNIPAQRSVLSPRSSQAQLNHREHIQIGDWTYVRVPTFDPE